jgi:hypothetical protein
MKRVLLTFALVGLLFSLAPRARAATEVSVNFFYDNLSPYGNWYDVSGYGYCFQPTVAIDNSGWRPYSDGYWAYTDAGWTWISYEDFGWATYHYGRWAQLTDLGWVWVPGYEWGPAWVSWRTGGDYVGWAPLPPEAPQIYEGRVITGHVDVDFNIGPIYYNFVDVRYIGEPVLRSYIVPSTQNVTIINRTVNVTNITYTNNVVNVFGPDYNRVNQYSTRPIQRLTLRRETQVNNLAQGGGNGNFNRVSGSQLTVVAPPIQKPQQQNVAPKRVAKKVETPRLEHGWQGVANRQQLQDEMKKESAKSASPSSAQPPKGTRVRAPVNQPNEPNPIAVNPGAQVPNPGAQNRPGQERTDRRTSLTPQPSQEGQGAPRAEPAADEASLQQAQPNQKRSPAENEGARGAERFASQRPQSVLSRQQKTQQGRSDGQKQAAESTQRDRNGKDQQQLQDDRQKQQPASETDRRREAGENQQYVSENHQQTRQAPRPSAAQHRQPERVRGEEAQHTPSTQQSKGNNPQAGKQESNKDQQQRKKKKPEEEPPPS